MKLGIGVGAALVVIGIGLLIALPVTFAVDCAGGICTERNLYGTATDLGFPAYWLIVLLGPALSLLGAGLLWRATGSPLLPGLVLLVSGLVTWLVAPFANPCQTVGDLGACAGGNVPLVGISLLMMFGGTGMACAGSARFMRARLTAGLLLAVVGLALFVQSSIRVESSGSLPLVLFGIGLAGVIGSLLASKAARAAANPGIGPVAASSS